ICYKESVPAAVGVMTHYFAALGQRDLKGMAEMLHFPFGTFERTEAVVVRSPDELMAHAPASMNMTEHPERFTDHDGYLKPGCYDVLDGIEIFNSDPVAVNLSLNYNRYSPDGYKLLRCRESIALPTMTGSGRSRRCLRFSRPLTWFTLCMTTASRR